MPGKCRHLVIIRVMIMMMNLPMVVGMMMMMVMEEIDLRVKIFYKVP